MKLIDFINRAADVIFHWMLVGFGFSLGVSFLRTLISLMADV